MAIKVIGAGLPRTGTNTLKVSLEKLGYQKTYHMKELLVHPEQLPYWLRLQDTGDTDWEKLYAGFEATVDFPGYPWYKEHMKQYPDAQVILTVRPFEKWYTSVYSTIWQAGPQTVWQKIEMMSKLAFNPRLRSVIKCVKFAKKTIFESTLKGKFKDKLMAEELFNQHIADVKAYVPADKLLIYDVTQGWGPLCSFLHTTEPSEPLPHLNKKENFKEMLGELMKGTMV